MGYLRRSIGISAVVSLIVTLITAVPAVGTVAPVPTGLLPRTVTKYQDATDSTCSAKIVDVTSCDPNRELLVASDAKDYPSVEATVSGRVFKHSGAKRGVMESSWKFNGWKGDKVPPDTPVGGVAVMARWFDGSTANGAWSPRFTAKSQADGTYKIALRPFVDSQGVTHTFKGSGGNKSSLKDQQLRVGVQTDDYYLVWAPYNGNNISKAVVSAGLADNVNWGGSSVSGYNFSLADKFFNGPGKIGITVEKRNSNNPLGSCAPSLAANYYKIEGNVFWDYAQNKLGGYSKDIEGEIHRAVIDWQPTIQKDKGDSPAKGESLGYYVVAWVPDDPIVNSVPPKQAVVGWGKVNNDGTYTVLVDGSGKFSLDTRNFRLNHIMLQLVQADGGEPALVNGELQNVKPIDSQYGFWNPTAGQFRSWTDTGPSETGTGLRQERQGACINNTAYSRLYNANFALFPWQAKLEISRDNSTWFQYLTAVPSDKLHYRATGLAPLSEYRLIADHSTVLVDSFTTDKNGNWSGTINNLSALPQAGWDKANHSLNVVLPGVKSVDLTKSPVVTSSLLKLVPYRVDTSPQELTVNETVAGGKQFKVEGATVETCTWGDNPPAGLTISADTTANSCVISGKPTKSGNAPVVLRVKTASDRQPTSWEALLRVHPQVLAQQAGAVSAENESAVPKFANVGQQFLGQVKVANDKNQRLMNFKVTQGGQELTEKNHMIDLGHGLKFVPGSGQIIGTPTLGAAETSAEVSFAVTATDLDGLEAWKNNAKQDPVPFSINIAPSIHLIDPWLPTVIAGQNLQSPSGTAVFPWIQGGQVTGVAQNSPLANSYASVTMPEGEPGAEIPDVATFKRLGFQATAKTVGGGQVLEITGGASAEVNTPTVLYLPVKVTDAAGRVFDGSQLHTLPQIKNSSAHLTGTEGWIRLVVLPKITAKTFKDATVGEPYPANSIADALSSAGIGQTVTAEGNSYTYGWDNYTYSAAGLPAGLKMEPDGRISGTPRESTPKAGVTVTLSLTGKAGTLAQKTALTLQVPLKVKSNFKVEQSEISATAVGGVTYTAEKSLKTAAGKTLPETINPSGGKQPYSYKLQVKKGGSWQDAVFQNGRYQIPNSDGTPSGLLLGPQGNILGSTIGKEPFPEMQLVVSDSDTVSCAEAGGSGGTATPCSKTLKLKLQREDSRNPKITISQVVVDLKSPAKGAVAVAEGSGQYTQLRLTAKNGFPQDLSFKITGTPKSGSGPASGVLKNGMDPATIDVGDGNTPHEFTFETVFNGTKPKVGKYPEAFTIIAKDLNGNYSTIASIAVVVTDTRIPTPAAVFPGNVTGPEEGVKLTTKAANPSAAAYFDAESADIACYVPQDWAATMGCPKKPQSLPGIPGMTLQPDGKFAGVPQKGTAGERTASVRAITKTGSVSNPVAIPVVIAPSTLEFRPGVPVGGVSSEAEYTWTFSPATGGAEKKHYRLVNNGGTAVSKCAVNTEDAAKPVLRCKTAAIKNQTGLAVEAYTQDEGEKTRITRSAPVEFRFVEPLEITTKTLFDTAEEAPYTAADGSTFRFQLSGGLGPYEFGFTAGSPHQKATAPDACNGWKLYSSGSGSMLGGRSVDTGLCLTVDGAITGKAAQNSAGIVDLSGLRVTDSLQRQAKLSGKDTSFRIVPKLQVTSIYPDADHSLQREKNQVLAESGFSCSNPKTCSVKVATITGGVRPFQEVKLLGLGQFVKLSAGTEDRLILQRTGDTWTGTVETAPQNGKASGSLAVTVTGRGDGPLEVHFAGNFSRITRPGLSATLKVVGGSEQVITAPIYVQVDTDLKFVKPKDTPAGAGIGIVPAPGVNGSISKPDSLSGVTDSEWNQISDGLDKTIPTLGIGLDKDAVEKAAKNGDGLKIPKLVEGGVEPFRFLTEPCDVKAANPKKSGQLDCAIGETGLFLDSKTGQIYGNPKPGAKTTAVIIVVDSDQPPQTKRSNLVVHLGDPRKPSVTPGQVLSADKDTPSDEAVVALQDGSGKYRDCRIAAVKPAISSPSWLTMKLKNGVCKLKWTGLPADAAESYAVTLKVQDENGNWNTADGSERADVMEHPVQTVSLQVADSRPPVIPSIVGMIRAEEGKNLDQDAFPPLEAGEQADGPKIKKWTVTGLPKGVSFDPEKGKISGYPEDGQVGDFQVTITAESEGGITAVKTVTLTVADSGLRIVLPTIPKPTAGQTYSITDKLQAVIGGLGTLCNADDCTFSLKNDTSTEEILTVDKDGTIRLTSGDKWPTGKESDTLTVVVINKRGITAETTFTVSANDQLDLSPKALPVVYAGESLTQCFQPRGGDSSQGYQISVNNSAAVNVRITKNSQTEGYCAEFNPTGSTLAGVKELTATIVNERNSRDVTLQLPVRVHRKLTVNPGTVTVVKGKPVSVTATLSGGECLPVYMGDSVTCDDSQLVWEIVNGPAGLNINGSGSSVIITGTVNTLYDGDVTVRVTRKHRSGDKHNTASFHLKVNTDLEVAVPNGAVVETQGDGSAVVKNGTPGTNEGSQLLPDKTTSTSGGSTGKYSIPDVTPDANGNYPIKTGGKDTGFALTPDGKIVGTLKPGIVTSTTGTTVSFPVVLTETDDKGHSSTSPREDVSFKITDTRKPEMAATTVSGQVGVAASGTLPGVDKSSESGKPRYSNFACTGQVPHELAAPASAMFNVDNSGTWTIADTFVPNKTDGKGKATWRCTGTITAANGQTASGEFTLEMHDQRSPKFRGDRERYVWEGRKLPAFTMRGTWIIDPGADASVPPLRTITVQNLPEGMKVVKANGTTEWDTETVKIPLPGGRKKDTKKWTCNLGGSTSEKCQITGHPVQGSAGQYVLTVTATGTNGITATDYPVVVNYASALKFAPLTGAVTKATVGSGYEQPVAVADYLRPLDFTDDAAYNGAGGVAGQNTTEAWTNTWALGNGAKVAVTDNQGRTAEGWTAHLVEANPAKTITACDSNTKVVTGGNCASLVQKNIKLSHTAAFSKAEIGAHNLSLELTDAHGMKKTVPVTVSVYAPLEWARAPFKTVEETAVLNPNKGITAGQPFADENGAAIYAEAVGGNSADYSSVLAADVTTLTAENADPKVAGYAGITPIWCQAQFAAGLKPSRPKCFPVPGLAPNGLPTGDKDNPYSGEGVFLLANGKFVGTVPASTNVGIHKAQVAVMDANRDLITKKFSIQVYAPLSVTGGSGTLSGGTRMKSYDSGEIFTVSGGSNSGYTCSFTPAIVGLKCEVGADKKVKISGTPKAAFKGKIQITVKDTADPSRSLTQGADLEIKTDLAFADPSGATAPAGSSISVETSADGEQTLKITTGGNDKPLEGSIPLNVTGGDVTPGAKPGTPKGYVFRLTDSHGNPIMGATCADDPKTSTDESKITDSQGATHERICYAIGNTGLQLTSDGKVIGTPIPGTKSDNFAVVADHALPPSTKSAKLDITIHDYRQPKAYPAILSTTVGANALTGYVSHDDFTNPPGVNPADTFSTEQQTAAGKAGFYATFPEDSWTKDKAPASANQGCDGKTLPEWLTIDQNGQIGLATGKTVPPALEDRASGSGKQAKPSGKYEFCVWYVGVNGMVSNPTVVSVTVTDNRNATPGPNNGGASRATVTPGTAVTKTQDPNVMTWEIPADLLQHSGDNIVKTNDVKKDGKSIYFTTTSNGYTDTEIPGLKGKGECADNSAGGKTCEFWVEGTPTPAGAGRSYNLTYTLTLANNQILVISKEVTVEAYKLDLSAGAMPVAWVGEPYTPGTISASGGIGTDLPIVPSGIGTIKSYDPTGKFLDSNRAIWAPSEADAQTAAKNSAHPGFLTLQLQVTDKTACDSWTTTGATCPYARRLEVQIPVAKRPSDTAIQGADIPQGSSWFSEPLMDSLNLQTQPGRHQEIISAQNDSGQPIPGDAITVADNKLQVGSNVPPGKYTVTVKTTVPGFGDFYRVVNFTVKERPAVQPNQPGNPNPSGNPNQPGSSAQDPADSGSTGNTGNGILSNTGSDTGASTGEGLIIRHSGANREDTALSVLDFFDSSAAGRTADGRLIVAYPQYADKARVSWSDTAVLVRDNDYADSLVSGPLAAQLNAPILLTPTKSMNNKTLNQLVKRGFKRVIIVGGLASVSENVALTIRKAGFSVERIGGADRYATATAVADRLLAERGSTNTAVFLATGQDYPDALAASAAAIKQNGVVLLTTNRGGQADTKTWMNSAKSGMVHAIGGPAVKTIDTYGVKTEKKVMGKNRYQTATAVATSFFPANPARVVVATGMDFPDATVATAITAKTGAPVTLTPAHRLAPITGKYLHTTKNSIKKIDILGGTKAVTTRVESEIIAVVTGKRQTLLPRDK